MQASATTANSAAPDLAEAITQLCRQARQAARLLATASAQQKNAALLAIAATLRAQSATILAANALDLAAGRTKGLSEAMLDRLALTEARLEAIAAAVEKIALLPDPCGRELETLQRPDGLLIRKLSVPMGVIGIIYESRPNVTVDSAALCLKAGSACVLRGGSEAIHSNRALATALAAALAQSSLPPAAVSLLPWTEREAVNLMLRQDAWIDLIIPRGGESLIRHVASHSSIPVVKHYKGVCHAYLDAAADPHKALAITVNAKCQRPGVCNALETLLVHKDAAHSLLPPIAAELARLGVELRGCPRSQALCPGMLPATAQDWDAEYLALILSVKVVDSLTEAIDHIERHGSRHSDAIITEDPAAARRFLAEVDTACCYHNASTRFTDGGEFGMGAEIGISTDKLHARGPMGLAELCTYKYLVTGDGHTRR